MFQKQSNSSIVNRYLSRQLHSFNNHFCACHSPKRVTISGMLINPAKMIADKQLRPVCSSTVYLFQGSASDSVRFSERNSDRYEKCSSKGTSGNHYVCDANWCFTIPHSVVFVNGLLPTQ